MTFNIDQLADMVGGTSFAEGDTDLTPEQKEPFANHAQSRSSERRWQDIALEHARTHAYNSSRADDCCGNCVSFKAKGQVYNDDHCKDTVSPWPNEHVERQWWCIRHDRRA